MTAESQVAAVRALCQREFDLRGGRAIPWTFIGEVAHAVEYEWPGQPGENEADDAGLAGRRPNESSSSPLCACTPHCGQSASHTEFSPYMDDFCEDCTLHRCDTTGHVG
jgi:hypothetical protein